MKRRRSRTFFIGSVRGCDVESWRLAGSDGRLGSDPAATAERLRKKNESGADIVVTADIGGCA